MVKYSHKAKQIFFFARKMRCILIMKRPFDLKLLLLLLLTCCVLLLSACGAEGGDTVGTGDPNENLGENIDTEPEKTDDAEYTTVNTNTKIIRTVKIYGETKNFTNANEAVISQLKAAGGYVETSEITGGESLYNGSKTPKNAVYVLRIPADKLEMYVESLKSMLNVTSYSESTQDVTLNYYDIQSRIKTLEIKKSSLEALLESAKNVNDIVTYQNELFQVISEIESLKSKLNVYDNKVTYSTVNLSVIEVLEYTETTSEEKSFGDKISDTFVSSWESLGTFFEYFAIFIVAVFPVLLLLGVIAVIVIIIIKLVKRNKRNKHND